MGLIKVAKDSIKSTLADQWKEYFYCDSLDEDTLVAVGKNKNSTGNSNIISQGSAISIADGQCALIVEQGRVFDICSEPGIFIFNSDSEPSVFVENLDDSLRKVISNVWERFKFGGKAGNDQRVYYFNLKEIYGNKFGTANPIPFRVVDNNIGLDVDISIRCNGIYSYKINNPVLFYQNVCGNVSLDFKRDQIDKQLKSELLNALQPAFAKISDMGIRYSSVPAHTEELSNALNQVLNSKWSELRGLEIVSISINSMTANKEDEDMIKNLQKTAVYRNTSMAAATLVDAQAEAMKSAAKNEAGAINGYLGLNMARASQNLDASELFKMSDQENNNQDTYKSQVNINSQANTIWKCPNCGTENTGNFCMQCGTKKPNPTWTCNCGSVNNGNFCENCGSKRP
ncbi:SPFH domain-containing protein [Peptostreptococcus equinus]|uniref:SPFH domain-containing protein n=1 Tax=Peptostreptococcus equinus TaxID=3003601 RepID=A0ABY7JP60_9FIRM|nr:SPFH domain-containing protein [Peptostreptococcus sp. CBA3647]WAW14266.1 SPFH domain-containing protein [Peptostreptococcus sp. CBA3647]